MNVSIYHFLMLLKELYLYVSNLIKLTYEFLEGRFYFGISCTWHNACHRADTLGYAE